MTRGTGYDEQAWRSSTNFPPADFAALRANGYQVTGLSHGSGVWALVMSRGASIETPPPVSSSIFPSDHIQEAWARGEYVTGLAYGDDEGPKLEISRTGGQIRVEWSGIGLLERATNMEDPLSWTTVAGNPNPYLVPVEAGNAYFRVRD
jgi:hypothetical protein